MNLKLIKNSLTPHSLDNWLYYARELERIIKGVEDIESVSKIQSSDPTTLRGEPYMVGMANGLILALSLLKGKDPKYLDVKPEQENLYDYLKDRIRSWSVVFENEEKEYSKENRDIAEHYMNAFNSILEVVFNREKKDEQ